MTIHQGEAVLNLTHPEEPAAVNPTGLKLVEQPKLVRPSARDWACISRMGGFGDNLIATSVLPGLKKRYGFVEVITGEPFHVMFENNPYIDKLSVYPKGKDPLSPTKTWNETYELRRHEYKFFANLSHSCEATGVFLPVQTQYYWPEKMRRKLCNRSYLEIVHDICDIPYDEIAPNFFPTDEEAEQARVTKESIGPRVVGWVMTGSRIDKIHPHADVAIAKIIRELGVPVVLFGAPGKDFEYAKLIMTEVKKLNHSLDGLHLAMSPTAENPSWPPRRICAQLATCDLVVGPDTGPMWSVAMRDMPKILLASHAGGYNITAHWKNTTTLEADQTRVPCYPCHRLLDDGSMCTPNPDKNGAACISDITVETIVGNVQRLLKG